MGVFALAFGLFAPVFTRLMLATPPAFIGALAGLAMLRVLQTAFNVSFRERFTLGALVTFLITVADVPIFNVGAPFWGSGHRLRRVAPARAQGLRRCRRLRRGPSGRRSDEKRGLLNRGARAGNPQIG